MDVKWSLGLPHTATVASGIGGQWEMTVSHEAQSWSYTWRVSHSIDRLKAESGQSSTPKFAMYAAETEAKRLEALVASAPR